MAQAMTLHPDRLFPADPTTRDAARRIYDEVKDLPILSPHGHVPPAWIADDIPFGDATELLITPDHYVNRIMHANGVELSTLGVPVGTELTDEQKRTAWRTFCEHWSDYNGTAMRYWMQDQLVGIFGIDKRPSAETADEIYDAINAKLATPEMKPRALMDSFDIAFIATTDDPCDDLHHHQKIAADESFTRRVVPTFRPDKYLEPGRRDWNDLVTALGEAAGMEISSLADYTSAMESRRAFFKENGAVSTDHSHADLATVAPDPVEAAKLFELARKNEATPEQCDQLRRHLLTDQVRMATEDGLTLTLHPAVARGHDHAATEEYGADVGNDIPVKLEVTRALEPVLNAFGNHPNLNLVLFTLDEDNFSREIAPLAGWYRSLYIGVPWWFIDAPESIMRFKQSVTEMAGFTRVSGMIDDTRAFCSIPARHDMSRRLDAAHLASLVVQHRLDEDEAIETAINLVSNNPKKVFKL
ncbi:glucuronate isomerase [Luteococcus sp. Sow4_B9]|uniref:glucuronate isomerase n=1 Tax=Luteococcus sp. Sow4_B9 TaxID=3438792 RepID=UPI003F9C4260